MKISTKVTLREIGCEFLDRLFNAALPGFVISGHISKSFDGRGNYALGIRTVDIPEINMIKLKK